MRAERLEDPADFVAPILERVKSEYIQRKYEVSEWTDHIDFLTKLATKSGRLGKGGEPDLNSVAVNIINDWQRGKLPYFVAPPRDEGDDNEADDEEDEGGDFNGSEEQIGGVLDDEESEEDVDEVSGNDVLLFGEHERLYGMQNLTLPWSYCMRA